MAVTKSDRQDIHRFVILKVAIYRSYLLCLEEVLGEDKAPYHVSIYVRQDFGFVRNKRFIVSKKGDTETPAKTEEEALAFWEELIDALRFS